MFGPYPARARTGRAGDPTGVRNRSQSLAVLHRAVHDDPMSVTIPDHLFVCIDHVGVAVPDLDEAIAFYASAFGMRLQHDEPRRGTAGSRINFVHPKDAGGVLVELVEPAAEPAHARAVD